MENPFKQIIRDEKLPELLKQRVVDDIALIKLWLEFADLFAIQVPDSLNEIIKSIQKDK
ncbi:hypothetical protein [Imtechella halotolerans]|uniref:hypothetical protein n=1 Tax=Imtechella halotolerans TaxID=1165090 RepID=UPI00032007C9|nr:hypothetical protein [Imtechella halotolerans]WMQ62873.1 hypothetical protein PT603_11090 [Imtechella halotolerans]